MTVKAIIGSMPWEVNVGYDGNNWRDKHDWCIENLGPKVVPNKGYMWQNVQLIAQWSTDDIWRFRNKEDAVLFYMTWMK